MIPELERVRAELEDARRLAHDVTRGLGAKAWTTRPEPTEWSVAECLAHLNLTSRAFLPLLDEALARGRAAGTPPRRPRMDLAGGFVWLVTTLRLPVKTTEPFVPAPTVSETVLTEFDELQHQLLDRVVRAEGVDLTASKIVSPFDARLRYNAYAAVRLITAHQRLHLRQAARARARVTKVADPTQVV